jgi:hypothetical protein
MVCQAEHLEFDSDQSAFENLRLTIENLRLTNKRLRLHREPYFKKVCCFT